MDWFGAIWRCLPVASAWTSSTPRDEGTDSKLSPSGLSRRVDWRIISFWLLFKNVSWNSFHVFKHLLRHFHNHTSFMVFSLNSLTIPPFPRKSARSLHSTERISDASLRPPDFVRPKTGVESAEWSILVFLRFSFNLEEFPIDGSLLLFAQIRAGRAAFARGGFQIFLIFLIFLTGNFRVLIVAQVNRDSWIFKCIFWKINKISSGCFLLKKNQEKSSL